MKEDMLYEVRTHWKNISLGSCALKIISILHFHPPRYL